jgi:hypothetical protein
MAGTPGPTLADMPREIKQEIIKGLDPLDLAAVSKTSRDLHSLMADDWLLCKSVYTQYLVSLPASKTWSFVDTIRMNQ